MTEHTNKQFDADLQRIRTELLQMGGLVESMIQDAMDALSSGDLTLVERVKEREKEVNRFEVDIDERVTQILARHQPGAALAEAHRLVAAGLHLAQQEEP